MKTCRKCKKEYKDDYSFCPKCGIPYDKDTKIPKIPEIVGTVYSIIKKVWNACLYCFGGFLVLGSLLSFKDDIISNTIGIIFGLSFFRIFYKLLSDKLNSFEVDKILKIARVALPIILMFVWASVLPTSESKKELSNDNSNIKQEEIKTTTANSTTIKQTTTTTIKPVEATYILEYNSAGDYGKLVEYEGSMEYFYYFPSGNYDIELIKKTGVICFLWLDYNNGYKNSFGTAYNNKEKLQFSEKGEEKSVTLTDDVHIYNSNKCNYKLTKKN